MAKSIRSKRKKANRTIMRNKIQDKLNDKIEERDRLLRATIAKAKAKKASENPNMAVENEKAAEKASTESTETTEKVHVIPSMEDDDPNYPFGKPAHIRRQKFIHQRRKQSGKSKGTKRTSLAKAKKIY